MIPGWRERYEGILREFGYSRGRDEEAAVLLDSILRGGRGRNEERGGAGDRRGGGGDAEKRIGEMIGGRTVFVVGAGPSLPAAIPRLRGYADEGLIGAGGGRRAATCIGAGSAAKPLADGGIMPDIVVTDLDGGDGAALAGIARAGRTVFVVHAHGDNMGRLHLARGLGRCVGTTQSEPFGRIRNHGGFTDGDRGAFLASGYGAARIILFGMDFGSRIGRLSRTKRSERPAKLRKLGAGESLLEWLSTFTRSELFTTSRPIAGFEKISYGQLDAMVRA